MPDRPSKPQPSLSAWMPICVVVALALGLLAFGPEGTAALRLDRDHVLDEPWRLFTGHWVHLTWRLAALNAATYVVFAGLFPALRQPASLLAMTVGGTLAVDAGFLVFHPHLTWYVGLSGVLYGYLAGGALLNWPRNPRLSGIVLGFIALKLARDRVYGTPAATEALVGGPVMDAAHVYGVGGGVVAGLLYLWMKRARRSQED